MVLPMTLWVNSGSHSRWDPIKECRQRAKELGARFFHISGKDYFQVQQPSQDLASRLLHPGARHVQRMEVPSGGANTPTKNV